MTQPTEKTREREKDKIYLTDAELCRWLGVPWSRLKPVLTFMEDKQGFPRKQELFGGRRYKPAVKAWLDRHNGITVDASLLRREAS